MRLFKYEGYKINIAEEAFALKAFRDIWKRDKSKNKEMAIQELAFIYFMVDPRSDYQIYVDEDVRAEEIKKGEGMDSKWKPDKLVEEGLKFYGKFKPASALLLEDTRYMVDRFRNKLKEIVDVEEFGVKELKEVSALIKGIPGLVKDLDEAERAITKEIIQNDRVRGSQEKSMFEEI